MSRAFCASTQPGVDSGVKTRVAEGTMTQQSAKRLPQWLTIDLAIIIVAMALIGVVLWIAP